MLSEYNFSDQNISDLNIIVRFLSKRDISHIDRNLFSEKYSGIKLDLVILLGNADIESIDKALLAYKELDAEALLISGGIGHSTEYLYENLRKYPEFQRLKTEKISESELMYHCIEIKNEMKDKKIYLENKSTNCGSNAKESLKVVRENGLNHKTVLLIQDSSMQCRTHASFLKEWAQENSIFINFSAQLPKIINDEGKTCFDRNTYPWNIRRYLSLVFGEIPRLRDDKDGYGPVGRGFIEHIEIPEEVQYSFSRLIEELPASFFQR